MTKTITLRLSGDDYRTISGVAQIEHRPISNLITSMVLKAIEQSFYVDPIEMAQIQSDKRLLSRLATGREAVRKKKYQFVGGK